MSLAKSVHRYQKWVLGSFVAVMALSLVVSFGDFNPRSDDSDKTVATIFGSVTVSEREWREALAKSGAWFRLKVIRQIDDGTDYNSQQLQPYLFSFRDGPGMLKWHQEFQPKPDDLTAGAREMIILGYDAKAKQVRASDEEVDDIIRSFLDRADVPQDDAERQRMFAREYFDATPEAFRAAVRDHILIEKALSLDVGGSNASYEDVFNETLTSARSVRVLVAGIDGSKLPGGLVPVTDDEIRARFEQDREKYKMPAKVQIEYLMVSFDVLKSRMAEPTPAEVEKYYNDHKREFMKTAPLDEAHHPGDGHDHPPVKEEFKATEEVREEIIRKIKDRQAVAEATKLITRISSNDVGDRWYKLLEEEKAREPKDQKASLERTRARTESILAEVRDKYKAEGIELITGTTIPFAKSAREPFDAEVGKPTANDPIEWAFQGPVGEIGHQIHRSDKGIAILRIASKIEGYETDLTGPIRDKIRQDLVKERSGAGAKRLADQLQARIREGGRAEIAKLRSRPDLKIQRSTYLAQATPDVETGLTPPSLVQQVKAKVLKAPSGPDTAHKMEAETIYGEAVGGDRKDWSYVVVVEDAVQVAPDLKDEEFLAEVRRKEMQEMALARTKKADELIAGADWKDAKAPPAQ